MGGVSKDMRSKTFLHQKEHRSNMPMDEQNLKVSNRDKSCKSLKVGCHAVGKQPSDP